MDIRFCDICNESVPLADLAQGRAQERAGRVVCSACESAMGGSAKAAAAAGVPAPRVHRQRASLGSRLALVGLSVAGVAAVAGGCWWGFGLQERLDELQQGLLATSAGVDVNGLQLIQLRGDLQRVDDDRARDEVRLTLAGDALERQLEQLSQELARLEQQVRGAEGTSAVRFDALNARIEDLRVSPARLERLEAGLARAEEDLEVLARSMLEGLDRAAAQQGLAGPDAAAPAEDAAWRVHVDALASEDPGLRWDAVEKIGAVGDPAAAPFLAPALADADLFVRMAAARVLGELGNSGAVPALIDALEDPESSVREAAVLSLRAITGRSFGFQPSADLSERERRVEAWRDWWARSGSEAP